VIGPSGTAPASVSPRASWRRRPQSRNARRGGRAAGAARPLVSVGGVATRRSASGRCSPRSRGPVGRGRSRRSPARAPNAWGESGCGFAADAERSRAADRRGVGGGLRGAGPGRARAGCRGVRRQGGWTGRPGPARGRQRGDLLAAWPYVRGGQSRPATLPPVGENSSGPLGPGLLASGLLGTIIRDLQAGLADATTPSVPNRQPIRKTERTAAACSQHGRVDRREH
jgi:hypothetical protein